MKEKTVKTPKAQSKLPVIAFVIPCYNEEEALPETTKVLTEKINQLTSQKKISPKSRVYYVDDGSADKTWQVISDIHKKNPVFCGIKLSHNRGHQNALLAGLLTAKEKADALISMDADLQDDTDAVDQMVEQFVQGNQIVYGVRSSRKTDTFFKRATAEGFYKVLRAFSDQPKDIIFNHADYRLMSKKALDAMELYGEVNLFLRGIIPQLGFKHSVVYYERHERIAGESKYPLKKMLAFAFQGITSLSIKPMRIITSLGAFIFVVSIAMLAYTLFRHFTGHTIEGWSSLAVSVWAIGGLLQMSIGVLGEYIGKIYLETKHRPRFIIDEIVE